MAPRLYATGDIVASIHKANGSFTHVAANVSHASIKPVHFRADNLSVDPVFSYANWVPASFAQLERWRAAGGVLLDRNAMPDLIGAGAADVLLLIEAPFTLERIKRAVHAAREHVVLARPHTWRIHEEAVDLQAPSVETLQKIWKQCRGQRMTDLELAKATGIPTSRLQYMRARFKPVSEWDIKPRLAPENPAYLPAWEWIGNGRSSVRKELRLSGHQAAVKEMARLGHIALEKLHRYPSAEPRWDVLERRRAETLAELAAVRALIESIPDYLEA
ncbi:hypothetical protein [Paraburkholderia aspalathi]|uniref:hypothetical protein n=1 Tax=Paraburkholderia aspalathi TaxID=1324617 RepID=UPI001B1A6482|nr:hypothetical protein [Paraburkholderia aspalathi]CAE6826789.1 hypothetical protein R20943_06439 [Paraburkholderia aspalathi]